MGVVHLLGRQVYNPEGDVEVEGNDGESLPRLGHSFWGLLLVEGAGQATTGEETFSLLVPVLELNVWGSPPYAAEGGVVFCPFAKHVHKLSPQPVLHEPWVHGTRLWFRCQIHAFLWRPNLFGMRHFARMGRGVSAPKQSCNGDAVTTRTPRTLSRPKRDSPGLVCVGPSGSMLSEHLVLRQFSPGMQGTFAAVRALKNLHTLSPSASPPLHTHTWCLAFWHGVWRLRVPSTCPWLWSQKYTLEVLGYCSLQTAPTYPGPCTALPRWPPLH